MKLYVLPLNSACNAHCSYCITKFRRLDSQKLKLAKLAETLETQKYDKIEITGGGEPSLHPQINKIVKLCSLYAPTQIYTNGSYTPVLSDTVVCLSRAHHDEKENEKIMGVTYDMSKFANQRNLKLSLMLHRNGISTLEGLKKYIEWARRYAKKVVVRQLFEYEAYEYADYYAREYVSSIELAEKFAKLYKPKIAEGNYFFDAGGLEVEFECRACTCEDTNLVLGADGVLHAGWSEL